MNDVKFEVLKSILEYMYLGEVHISNENLKEFIRVAEGLKIRGLTKGKDRLMSNHPPMNATPPIAQLEFDSDLSQSSPPVDAKRTKMSHNDSLEGGIPQSSDRNGLPTSSSNLHIVHQQDPHHHHHQQQHHNSALSHHQEKRSSEKQQDASLTVVPVVSSVEPKVEMVEFMDGTTHPANNVPAPPPAYCQMQIISGRICYYIVHICLTIAYFIMKCLEQFI